jgi:hypothetical protein
MTRSNLSPCLLVFLVIAAGLPARAENRQPAVEDLPEFARLEEKNGTVFILRGKLTKRRGAQMARLARAVQRDVTRRFMGGADKSHLSPVDMCLFESTREYMEFVEEVFGKGGDHSELGFYVPSRRLVLANLGHSVGNLRHEMAHALIGDDFPKIPDWLNEGLGSLYGTATLTKKGFRFRVNYRLRHLKTARKDGTLPDLATLAASTRHEVYGANSMAYYALARYLLLYLDRKGKLNEFFAAMRTGPLTAGRQLTILTEFVDYEKFLKWTDMLWIRRPGKKSGTPGT